MPAAKLKSYDLSTVFTFSGRLLKHSWSRVSQLPTKRRPQLGRNLPHRLAVTLSHNKNDLTEAAPQANAGCWRTLGCRCALRGGKRGGF
jgi:hypothetical protein